jgi:hypothetical protein
LTTVDAASRAFGFAGFAQSDKMASVGSTPLARM